MKAYVKGIRYNNRYGMKSKEVAPILAKMDPAKAKQITDELAQRHQMSQALRKTGI